MTDILEEKPFDYWVELYNTDPERYEKERLEALKNEAERISKEYGADLNRSLAIINGNEMRLSKFTGINRYNAVVANTYETLDHFKDGLENFSSSMVKIMAGEEIKNEQKKEAEVVQIGRKLNKDEKVNMEEWLPENDEEDEG